MTSQAGQKCRNHIGFNTLQNFFLCEIFYAELDSKSLLYRLYGSVIYVQYQHKISKNDLICDILSSHFHLLLKKEDVILFIAML